MGIGSGIIADSDPEQEWQECLLKARFLTHPAPVFQLIETFLWEPGTGYWLRDEHLHRLTTSAAFFLFSCDVAAIGQRLDEESRSFSATPMRVRLTLAKDGGIVLGSQQFPAPALRSLPAQMDDNRINMPKIGIARSASDTTTPWVFHKTTVRQIYDQVLAEAREKGLFDCLFCNERGDLTEGCMTNIILYRQGEFVTPPLSSGLLAGVMREQLLANAAVPVREQVLSLADLRQAEAIFLCNSVRGVVQVALEGP
jgi:para-aminobenzoate synthetase/4-amino-4-deoxychorismate lyase